MPIFLDGGASVVPNEGDLVTWLSWSRTAIVTLLFRVRVGRSLLPIREGATVLCGVLWLGGRGEVGSTPFVGGEEKCEVEDAIAAVHVRYFWIPEICFAPIQGTLWR